MNPTYDFGGQVALVTGAGGGMGLDTARAFAAGGAAVVLADVNEQALRAATDELRAEHHRVLGVASDVADEDQVAALVDRTVTGFGRLDMAFNNAGIMLPLPRHQARRARPDQERRAEYAPRGIRINAVCPGTIETPMVADMMASGELTSQTPSPGNRSAGWAAARRSQPRCCGCAAPGRASSSA